MSVRKSIVWSLTGSVGFFVIQFAASVVVARLLTPAELGIYGIALSAVLLITAFQNLGFQSFLVREATLDAETIGTVHSMAITQGFGLAALLYVGAPLLADFLSEPRLTPALRILCLFAILSPIETLASGHLQRRGRFDLLTAIGITRVVVSSVAGIWLAFAGYSYASLSWGAVIGQLAAGIAGFAFAGRDLLAKPTFARWRVIWAFGSNILVTMALGNIFSRLPDIALGRLAGVAMVGLYGRAAGIVDSFNSGVMYGLQRVIMKALVDERDQVGGVDRVYIRALTSATGLFWPMYAGLAVLATPVITFVYGAKWVAAAPVLALLCIAAMVQTALIARQEILIVTGRERALPLLEGARGTIGLSLFVVGASYGLAPAAASRIGEAIAQHILFVREIRSAIGVRFGEIYHCYGKSLIVTLAAALPPTVVMQIHDWPLALPVGEMLGAIGAGILMWVVALYVVRHELRHEIANAWQTVRGRFR